MTINEGAVLVGHAGESGEHPDQTERCSCYGMPNHWGDHLDLARCVALIGEHDLGQATTAMGRCLFHLQRDLLVEIWTVRTQRGGHGSHLRTAPFEIAENSVPN